MTVGDDRGNLAQALAALHAEAFDAPWSAEAFADRAYQPDGQLVSRTEDGAVLHDPAAVAERMVRLASEGVIRAIDGTDVTVAAQSICVHGDSPGSVAMAAETKRLLQDAGIAIAPFAGA